MMARTGTNSQTVVFEANAANGVCEQVYPCHCGEVHTGDYGLYEFGHHNCLHRSPLFNSGDEQWMCPNCGKVFWLEKGDAK